MHRAGSKSALPVRPTSLTRREPLEKYGFFSSVIQSARASLRENFGFGGGLLASNRGGRPAVFGAGRTDAGVHAIGQVAHLDMGRPWDPARLAAALNAHLRPHPVAVLAAAEVAEGFHARFDAVEREYVYRMIARRAPLTRDAGFAWRVERRPDLAALRAGAAQLIGRHDFTTFRSSICQAKSPVRTLDEITVTASTFRTGETVTITDRGRPAHVLLTIEAYQRLTQKTASIADLLAMPGVADIDFEAPRVGRIARPADLR